MLSRVHPSFCPACRRSPGLDCPDAGVDRKTQRGREKAVWRREARMIYQSGTNQ